MSLLKLRGLHKAYGERELLDIPVLDLQRGLSYILTGPNGAGKTTLLRILAGLETARIDHYVFDGAEIRVDAINQMLAPHVLYMHQQPYLFSTSVEANVAYGLKLQGLTKLRISRHEIAQRVEAAMQWAGVMHLVKTPPHKLSGGEKQRVALARAKVLNPDLLLLDEPTANLDESARNQVAGLIRQMCDNNHCVVIATHDPELLALENAVNLRLKSTTIEINSSTV